MTKTQLYLRVLAKRWREMGHKTAADVALHIANNEAEFAERRGDDTLKVTPAARTPAVVAERFKTLRPGEPMVHAITATRGRQGDYFLNFGLTHDGGETYHSFGGYFPPKATASLLHRMAQEGTSQAAETLSSHFGQPASKPGRRPKLDTSEPAEEGTDWRPNEMLPEDYHSYGRKRRYARYSEVASHPEVLGLMRFSPDHHAGSLEHGVLADRIEELGFPTIAGHIRSAKAVSPRPYLITGMSLEPTMTVQLRRGQPVASLQGGGMNNGERTIAVSLRLPAGDGRYHQWQTGLMPASAAAKHLRALAAEGVGVQTTKAAPPYRTHVVNTDESAARRLARLRYAAPAWWPRTGWGGGAGKEPITHEKVNAWLGKKNEKQLSRNRKVWRDHTGDIHLRLHYTNIVTWHPDGSYTLNTGGWHSPTTARNMAAVIGLPVQRVNKRGRPPQLGVQGKPIVDGAKWEPVMPPAPEQDWRPDSMLPEDHYSLSRRKRRYAQKKPRTADFLTAVRVLRGSGQKRLHAVAEDVARGLGLSPAKTRDALLDGPRGALPGVAQAVAGADPHTARYAAAWYGLLARTPSLGLFHVRPDGPDSLYKFHVRGSAHTARRVLDRHGIAARVLLPHGAGYDVVVPDPGRRMRANALKAAGHLGGRVEESVGHLEPLGHADPAQARSAFRKIVERYEGGRR